MLLLALQTTTSAAGDSRIDTLTLVLVVIFIAAMLALSLLIRRPESDDPSEPAPDPRQPEAFAESPMPVCRLCAGIDLPGSSHGSVPRLLLQGVSSQGTDASLSACHAA